MPIIVSAFKGRAGRVGFYAEQAIDTSEPVKQLWSYWERTGSEGSSATARGRGSPPRAWAQCAASKRFAVALQASFFLVCMQRNFHGDCKALRSFVRCVKSLRFLVVSLLEYICNYLDYAVMKLL